MFPFNYKFEREIITQKTAKQVIDAVRNSLTERDIDNIYINENNISGKESLFKIDTSSRSPLTISPSKEEFEYNESKKVLTYKINIFISSVLFLVYPVFLFFILSSFTDHLINKFICSVTVYIMVNLFSYLHYLANIDKISKVLNDHQTL